MGRLVNKKRMVRMSKGGVSHDFVLESVPVWEAKGWKRENGDQPEQTNEVAELLREEAGNTTEEKNPDEAVYEALSNEPKAVTGPKTKK